MFITVIKKQHFNIDNLESAAGHISTMHASLVHRAVRVAENQVACCTCTYFLSYSNKSRAKGKSLVKRDLADFFALLICSTFVWLRLG